MNGIAIVETHPVQYHAPVWRAAARDLEVPLHVLYGGDFSVRGYLDREFGTSFQWDADLLSGYDSTILHPVLEGGPADYESVTAAGVGAALDRLNPSAVLCLGYHHPLDRAAQAWAVRRRVPLLFRGEVSDAAGIARSWWKSRLRDVMLRSLYRRCAACLYLGRRAQEHYLRLGVPLARLVRSPYCVDDSAFQADETARLRLRAETRQHFGIPEDAWVVLFSGKLSRRKGVDFLPQAVRALPEALRRHVHLLFLGDGERRQALTAACAEAPAVSADFTGFQNQSHLSPFYLAADVLVLPSVEMETWGLVVNDAMHHGLPCVVTNVVGSAPDLVVPGLTGEVCAPGDAVALEHALAACAGWSRKGGLEIRQRCREHVQEYSVRRAAEGLARAWQLCAPGQKKSA